MADNTYLRRLFPVDSELDKQGQFDLSRSTRHRRMREIMRIARQHGLPGSMNPVAFRSMLEDLGPSFVKIGQTLSSRSEILPQSYCDELAKLRAECDPLPFEDMLVPLEAEYGDNLWNLFSRIDPTPLGSASLAQVHRGQLASGEEVAIKIQRPGVKATMALDIDIMRSLTKTLSHFVRDDQIIDLRGVVDEMWETFLEETDFRQEARNLKEFAEKNASCVYVTCPQVYQELCTEYVLVMEYIQGTPIQDKDRLIRLGYNLEEIGEKLLDNYAAQILDQGFFHADPHPGNLFVRDGKIVYIDLGNMGRFSASDRQAFGAIIEAIGMRDASALKDALFSFATITDPAAIDHGKFLANLDDLLAKYGSGAIGELDIGTMMLDLIRITHDAKAVLPASITDVSRGIVTIEGTIGSYVPNRSIVEIITEHLKHNKTVLETTEDALNELGIALHSSSKGILQASSYAGDMMRMLTRGQLKINTEMLGSADPSERLSRIMARLTMAIIAGTLFIGSSMLASIPHDPVILGMPIIAFISYVGAFVISVWVVVDIWRGK